jgi:activator of 2-hydroxyglutaryl-CoA dehydratase
MRGCSRSWVNFTVGLSPCVRTLLEELLGTPVIVPDQPDRVGALGAALHGEKRRRHALAETADAS